MARATSRLTRRHVYPVAVDEQARWEVAAEKDERKRWMTSWVTTGRIRVACACTCSSEKEEEAKTLWLLRASG